MEGSLLLSLPKEILSIIVNLVGTEDLLKTESTSKQWQKLGWELISMLDVYTNAKSMFDDAKFLQLLKKANPLKLRKIDISGDKTLTEDSLIHLSSYPNIVAFSCRSLPRAAIQEVISVLPNVRRLDLCSQHLSDSSIALIAQKMSYLTKLLVGNSSAVRALTDITRLSKLEVLNLAFSDKVDDEGMLEICKLTQLKKLDLCWLKNITGDGFQNISTLTKLLHLDISNLMGVQDSYLTALLALTNLELLDTSYYKNLTDFGISIIGKLPKLTRLIMVQHSKVTSAGLNNLTDLTQLNHLSLGAMSHISNDHYYSSLFNLTYLSVRLKEQNFTVLTNLTQMKDLNIHTLHDIDDVFFRCCSVMPLERLYLHSNNYCIDVDMLTTCTNLTSLDFEGSSNFHETPNDSIIDRLVALTTLKHIGLRYDGNFNRLSALKNLCSLHLKVPLRGKVTAKDFECLLELPELDSLILRSPLPDKELRNMFSTNKKLTHLEVETETEDIY